MIDLFKRHVSKGSTAGQASADNRQEYLQYADEKTSKGEKPVSYAEWLKGAR